MTHRRIWTLLRHAAAMICAATILVTIGEGRQDTPVTVWDGVYTEAQAERGAARYETTCGMCHGADMAGAPGVPGLVGIEFLFFYNEKTVADVFDYVKMNMPPGQQGSLTDQQYADVVAAMMKGNGFPASDTAELSADLQALAQVVILRTQPD